MSDSMRDALMLSGVLLAIVLFTQVGRHEFGIVKILLPLALVVFVGWDVLRGMSITTPNVLAAAIGTAIGLGIGFGLLATMRVERDHAKGKSRTRAGLPYLLIWLVVLLGRLVFIWALENVDSFGRGVAKFLVENSIEPRGLAAFFVLMAMTMVLVRTVGTWVRSARLSSGGDRQEATAAA